jgi:hypothetical protein
MVDLLDFHEVVGKVVSMVALMVDQRADVTAVGLAVLSVYG